MTQNESKFREALKRGEKWALGEFYNRLSSSRDDSTFWNELMSLVPYKIRQDEGESIQALRLNLNSSSFDLFLKSIPIHILAAFLMLAMLFSSCNQEAERKTEQSNLSSIGNKTLAETKVDTDLEEKPDSGVSPVHMDVDYMNVDELKKALDDYIVMAQLPASEKRRLKAQLSSANKEAVLGAKSDLSRLFKENDPVQIADILEQMVLFSTTSDSTNIKPHNVTKYKGANFNNEKLPPMQTAYKGVNFK